MHAHRLCFSVNYLTTGGRKVAWFFITKNCAAIHNVLLILWASFENYAESAKSLYSIKVVTPCVPLYYDYDLALSA